MLKFIASMPQGTLYGFGLSEADLNRLEFNNEPIFFNFGYAGHPELFGLILYVGQFQEPTDIFTNIEAIKPFALPFFDSERGVTPETLRFFPLARNVMQKFRSTPFWGFESETKITSRGDLQLFCAGRDETDIEKYFRDAGFIKPTTKRTYKGFGK